MLTRLDEQPDLDDAVPPDALDQLLLPERERAVLGGPEQGRNSVLGFAVDFSLGLVVYEPHEIPGIPKRMKM
jgi:hypothetical protein